MRMWGAKTKNKAVNLWHIKAMLIDPKKTKLTIIWSTAPNTHETEITSEIEELNVKTNEPNQSLASDLAEVRNVDQSREDTGIIDQKREPKFSLLEAFNTVFPLKN